MDFGFSVLAFLLVLTPIVFIHELGHYWAARRSGVVVEVFSVGFGPEIFGFTDRHQTRWKFSAIPLGGYVKMAEDTILKEEVTNYRKLGGYVKMAGDTNAASAPDENAMSMKGSFQAASLKARAFIVAMGPIANFILGVALIAAVYMSYGKVTVPSLVGEVQQGSAAEKAGLEVGDRVISANGYTIDDFNQLRTYIFENPGQPVEMVVERDGGLINRTVIPDVVEDKCMMVSYGRLGVRSMGGEIKSLGLSAAVSAAAVDSFDMAITMLRGIGRLASGNANQGEIGGPIKIAEISGRVASQGFMSLMMFVAIISINLGLVNLLPIPSLDGGHLMFFGLEAVMGKPISPAIQDLIMRGGMALLLTLIVFVTFFDISSLFMAEC